MKLERLLTGLVAAVHSPFRTDGSLHLDAVEAQAAHLLSHGIRVAFVGGSTGECHSLSLEERSQLARRWVEVARGTALGVVVHVGSNCLADARSLAAQAEGLGAAAVAALSPSYFKPRDLDTLVACCADIAAAAPRTPFYFYDIPVLTGVSLPMPDFLERAASRIPTLAGLKFTSPDLLAYQLCLRAGDGAGFVAEVERSLTGYAGDKLGRPVAGLTRGELSAALTAAGASPPAVGALVAALDGCDAARFGGAAPGEPLLTEAAEAMAQLEESVGAAAGERAP